MLIKVIGARPGRSYGYRHTYRENVKGGKETREVVEHYSVGAEPVEVPDHIGETMTRMYEDVEEVVAEAPADGTLTITGAGKTEDPAGKAPAASTTTAGSAPLGDNQYLCSKCKKPHMKEDSKIGDKHRKFAVA